MEKQRKKTGPKPRVELTGRMEEIEAMLLEGLSYQKIIDKIGCPMTTFHDFISKPENSARAREALIKSAQVFDAMAEEVLKQAPGTMAEIQRARELAQHYRWRASKRNPKDFGDKVETTVNGNLNVQILNIDPLS